MNIYDAAKIIKKIDKVCNKQQKKCAINNKSFLHTSFYIGFRPFI